jgi:DHA1 family inner membrane transport protein
MVLVLDAKLPRPSIGLLGLGAFAIACTEFMIVGLMPGIARELHVSSGAVGQLVTLNAAAVVVATPLLAAWTARFSPRRVLALTLAAFAAAHLIAALAPSFPIVLATRVVTGAAFGLYLALAFAVATRLVPTDRRARALAKVQAGITLATGFGVPATMLVGTISGWRLAFLAVAGLAVIAAFAHLMLPDRPLQRHHLSLRDRLAVLAKRPVLLGLAAIAMFWGGSLCAFTYVVPFLHETAGIGDNGAVAVLFAAGIAGIAGNALGGRGADTALRGTLVATASASALALALLAAFGHLQVMAAVLVVLWQLAAWSYVPAIQVCIHRLGGQAADAAVSFSVAAFNVGILAGAAIGGLALDLGGNRVVLVTAATLVGTALALTASTVPGKKTVRP